MADFQQDTLPNSSTNNGAGRFGTFAGVFTPNVLTILGIILFLRTGYVVGQAGMIFAIIIVLLANLITFLTGLSLSAIATSMEVGAGGNYYMISRSLGLEVGGAIGIPLFLSQAISVAFYVIGFTEALAGIPSLAVIDPRLIATGVVLLFAIIAFIGADFALKIQFFILAILIAAIFSFFAGGWDSFITPTLTPTYTEGNSYWSIFALFFPAVTGIAVGASMSGDLKDPSRSIPLGTLWSIAVTAIVYVMVVVWFALHVDPATLSADNLIILQVARWPRLILAGVWASTLSSALGSILAAPRTLQAIALDNVVPRWIASQMGSKTEPRLAVLITSAIAFAVIWMGDLNFVAPVITMFFLNTYGMLNLVAAIESLVGNPSFRPTMKLSWYWALLGALGCYGTMFLIEWRATIVAIVFSYGIFFYLQRREVRRTWGDVRTGIWITLARAILLQLEARQQTVKNWRPNLLVFTGQPHNRERLVEVADWLSLGRGIVTFFQLIEGDVQELARQNLRVEARKQIQTYIRENGMRAFAEVEIVPEWWTGAITMVQGHGIAGLEPNSILMGWSGGQAGRVRQMRLLRSLIALRKSVIFLNYDVEKGFGRKQEINIWWHGRGGNGDLMLLLAHLLSQHRSWNRPQINVINIVENLQSVEPTREHTVRLLKEVRVAAIPEVIVRQPGQSATDIIQAHASADLTFLGMSVPEDEDVEAYADRLHKLVSAVGSVMLIRNAELDADLLAT